MVKRRSVYDPRVQYAVAKRRAERHIKLCRARALAELSDRGSATLGELVELTGLPRAECAEAIDQLRREAKVVLEDDGRLVMASC